MTVIRSTLYAVWFYGCLVVIGLAFLPFALFSRRAAMRGIRVWANLQRWAMRWLCGARTEVRGLANVPAGACIIAMKHQSTYDTIAPFTFFDDPAFILKRELLSIPIFGLYAARARMIPIDRGGRVKAMKAMMQRAKEEAEAGRKIIIFPEGTRQDVDAPTDLKSGVVAMYRDLALPCVPVALNTGLAWKGAGFTRKPGHIVFDILPPIPPGLSRDEFMQRLEMALDPATRRLVAEGRAVQAAMGVAVAAAKPT